MKTRTLIEYDKNWMDHVEPGVPFNLVGDGVESSKTVTVVKAPRRGAPEKARRLSRMGELFTIQEVALRLKVSKSVVYNWIYSGQLRKTQVGGLIRIALSDLEDFLSA